MVHMKRIKTFFICLLILIFTAEEGLTEEENFSLSGHYRNLLVSSETVVGKERYWADNNRLRLEAKGEPTEHFSYNLQYDHHLAFGDYLSTVEFKVTEAAAKAAPRATYWDMEEEITRHSELSWRHSLYRGYGVIRQGKVDITVGRQRIPWGKGWFWSPLDMFNPASPTAIERDERQGVDGLLMTVSGGMVNSISLLYLPQQDSSDSAAVRAVGQLGSYDIALSGGRHRERDFAAIDFAGYIGDAGFYGEVVSLEDAFGDDQTSLLFSGNYNFESSLYIMLEYFHHGGADTPWTGIRYGGEDYAGLNAGYDLTPLTRWDNYLIVNLDDESWFFSPALRSSFRENIDLGLGVQFFGGDAGNEYNGRENVYYAEFSWFF